MAKKVKKSIGKYFRNTVKCFRTIYWCLKCYFWDLVLFVPRITVPVQSWFVTWYCYLRLLPQYDTLNVSKTSNFRSKKWSNIIGKCFYNHSKYVCKYVGISRAVLWDLTALFMRLVQGLLLVITTYDCYMRYLPKIVNFKDCYPR